MSHAIHRPRRSVLYVPATNEQGAGQDASLACDAVIIDLEDAVAPERQGRGARDRLAAFRRSARRRRAEIDHPHQSAVERMGRATICAGRARCSPTRILLPKVDTPRDILEADDVLDEAMRRTRSGCGR